MKTRTLTISILLLAVVLAPLAMAAEEPARRGGRGGQGGPGGPRGEFRGAPGRAGMGMYGGQGDIGRMLLGRAAERLELTQEQKDQIKEIIF